MVNNAVVSHNSVNELYYLEEVDSTNTWAKANLDKFGPVGAVYTTSQTAGRGRRGHTWINASGQALYYTVVLKTELAQPESLPLFASMAVADALEQRYGIQCQGATDIALTKLDVLSYLDKIPVCAHYELNGEVIDEFPFPTLQSSAKPVMEYMEGWKCDISGVRKWEDLPEAARKYVEYVEEKIGCRIGYVSVGPERDSIIIR